MAEKPSCPDLKGRSKLNLAGNLGSVDVVIPTTPVLSTTLFAFQSNHAYTKFLAKKCVNCLTLTEATTFYWSPLPIAGYGPAADPADCGVPCLAKTIPVGDCAGYIWADEETTAKACPGIARNADWPECVEVAPPSTDPIPVEIDWSEMPLGIEGDLAPTQFCTDDEAMNPVFICKIIDEETQVATFIPHMLDLATATMTPYSGGLKPCPQKQWFIPEWTAKDSCNPVLVCFTGDECELFEIDPTTKEKTAMADAELNIPGPDGSVTFEGESKNVFVTGADAPATMQDICDAIEAAGLPMLIDKATGKETAATIDDLCDVKLKRLPCGTSYLTDRLTHRLQLKSVQMTSPGSMVFRSTRTVTTDLQVSTKTVLSHSVRML